jgi:hypothetical protein
LHARKAQTYNVDGVCLRDALKGGLKRALVKDAHALYPDSVIWNEKHGY